MDSLKKKLIKNAINIYNTKRPHFSNHMLTPIQMHEQNKLKRKQYKNLRNLHSYQNGSNPSSLNKKC